MAGEPVPARLPLTNREKRRAVLRLLREYPECSTRELAEMAATSHSLVAQCKKSGAAGTKEGRASQRRSTAAHARKLLAAAASLGEAVQDPGDCQEPALALAGAARQLWTKAETAPALAELAAWIAAARAILEGAPAEAAVNG